MVCKLSDIGYSELGKTLDRAKNTGNLRPYLCAVNVDWNKIEYSPIKEMKIEPEEEIRYKLVSGDLLVCEGGECGRCAVFESDREMYYQNALHRIRFKVKMNPYYFQLLFSWLYSIGVINSYSKGMTIKHFTKTAINSLPLIVPPIKEQNRIVRIVNRMVDEIDNVETLLN